MTKKHIILEAFLTFVFSFVGVVIGTILAKKVDLPAMEEKRKEKERRLHFKWPFQKQKGERCQYK